VARQALVRYREAGCRAAQILSVEHGTATTVSGSYRENCAKYLGVVVVALAVLGA
jgi:hypothetical protein